MQRIVVMLLKEEKLTCIIIINVSMVFLALKQAAKQVRSIRNRNNSSKILEREEKTGTFLSQRSIKKKQTTFLSSISSTFYVQLLRTQIPNAQKRQSSQQCRLALLGPMGVKAVCRMLMKFSPGVNFTTFLRKAFTPEDSLKCKKTGKSYVFFCTLGDLHA